ncbi:MAG: tRNA uridine-5-carboxymethylaminomethyl(34) synthesis GTPase MnmE [Planctomycetes bacterium]|nr:tRNA uridine-5-carboxymethylaminomethyl(34) synthesis GTPase MnmE [Planctomycetota bacterium]
MVLAADSPSTVVAEDTIVAVSSPAGSSSRAIIRLSGPRAVCIAGEIFRGDAGEAIETMPTYTSADGQVTLPNKNIRAPAVVYVMKMPWSYTREDVVEVHTIGSAPLVEMIVESILDRGARLAEPGEFTRRAFLHGRIDLAQAEGVMAVIRARSEAELRVALACLRGKWTERIGEIRSALMDLCAHVELMIDFSDQDTAPFSRDQLRAEFDDVKRRIEAAMTETKEGTIRTDAVATAIYGRPNVGKSSLMNALGVSRRSIVHPSPGTTRDTVQDVVDIGGVRFRFLDTAGLRDTIDDIETIAAERARKTAREADLGLLVLDGSTPLSAEEHEIAEQVSPPTVIAVINKCDLPQKLGLAEVRGLPRVMEVIITSALTGAGIAELKEAMVNTVSAGRLDRSAGVATANARRRDAIQRAMSALRRAREGLDPDMDLEPELAAFELRDALSSLGQIAGEVTPDDLLNRIFSQFCIGK